ncbi:MAG: mitochondrial fission ELM1 family protein [Alphaproteobacteria bacterium]
MAQFSVERTACWVVTDGKAGMESQCRALAAALGLNPTVKRIAVRPPWRWLPPSLWPSPQAALQTGRDGGDNLAKPWPDLIISTGRQTVAPVLDIKRRSGRSRPVRVVQIQNPRVAASRFDLVIAPRHDRLDGDNVIVTLGALHAVTPAALAAARAVWGARLERLPRPRVAVLLGGGNRAYRLGAREGRAIAAALAALAATGAGLMVTPSRRTPPDCAAAVRAALSGHAAIVWDGSGDNPYPGFLALADAVLVTADSVNMVSEAAGTGRPVHVIDLPGGSARFRRFHRAMREAGVTRPFAGRLEDWTYPVPDDTARAARAVAQRLELPLPAP